MSDELNPRNIEDPVPAPPADEAASDRPRGGPDPRPPSQVEAEEGARENEDPPDPRLRAAEINSAREYAADGIMGAPGSEADPGGDEAIEPYPVQYALTPAQAEEQGEVTRVEGAPGAEPGYNPEPEAEGHQ